MWCTASACNPRISGVATLAAVDVNQPRAKTNTMAITCLSCATEQRRLVGGGIGMTTGGRRANYEHSEQARAPQTNGPRDVPRCGALSLLQKTLHYKGG
jgi:hypothetical protein